MTEFEAATIAFQQASPFPHSRGGGERGARLAP